MMPPTSFSFTAQCGECDGQTINTFKRFDLECAILEPMAHSIEVRMPR
jgi:hypothetical protein